MQVENPMVGENHAETLQRCIGALQWLAVADRGIESGKPNEQLQLGRFFLEQCCFSALRGVERDIGQRLGLDLGQDLRERAPGTRAAA